MIHPYREPAPQKPHAPKLREAAKNPSLATGGIRGWHETETNESLVKSYRNPLFTEVRVEIHEAKGGGYTVEFSWREGVAEAKTLAEAETAAKRGLESWAWAMNVRAPGYDRSFAPCARRVLAGEGF